MVLLLPLLRRVLLVLPVLPVLLGKRAVQRRKNACEGIGGASLFAGYDTANVSVATKSSVTPCNAGMAPKRSIDGRQRVRRRRRQRRRAWKGEETICYERLEAYVTF